MHSAGQIEKLFWPVFSGVFFVFGGPEKTPLGKIPLFSPARLNFQSFYFIMAVLRAKIGRLE